MKLTSKAGVNSKCNIHWHHTDSVEAAFRPNQATLVLRAGAGSTWWRFRKTMKSLDRIHFCKSNLTSLCSGQSQTSCSTVLITILPCVLSCHRVFVSRADILTCIKLLKKLLQLNSLTMIPAVLWDLDDHIRGHWCCLIFMECFESAYEQMKGYGFDITLHHAPQHLICSERSLANLLFSIFGSLMILYMSGTKSHSRWTLNTIIVLYQRNVNVDIS